MTDREKAIVMAYTGVTMLSGEKFSIFHKYVEEILGRPVWTHELAIELVWNEIKEKSKDDFLEICKTEDNSDDQGEWIEDYYAGIHCSECDYTPLKDVVIKINTDGSKVKSGNYNLTPYCPNCGAKMKKGGAE